MPYPYGGKQRQVQMDLDTAALQSKGLSPLDVVNAISAQNLILPSGTAKIGSKEYDVDINGSPTEIAGLNQFPMKTVGSTTIYIHDVGLGAGWLSSTDQHCARERAAVCAADDPKGRQRLDLDMITGIKSMLPQIKASLPPELDISRWRTNPSSCARRLRV